ncbi:hypothetical protein [Rhizohabitans arisaemae]|uniref:hypothetical protein n=1 Tax=Rhizohabitans arisaemae TaxID=2720610 RepID=UPI0024B277DC|nr:hypothetical protein [Rhizohabitans arisaemae]
MTENRYDDPPAPTYPSRGAGPESGGMPAPGLLDRHTPGGAAPSWVFNPEYEKLIILWRQVEKLLDELTPILDPVLTMARSKDVWDAPVAERYVQDLTRWRQDLIAYRATILGAISRLAGSEAVPKWIPAKNSPEVLR